MLYVAQLGVGYWGPNLLRNLVASELFSVKTVVDLSEERRSYVRGLYPGIRVVDEPEVVFQDAEIQAVVIATPVATHHDLAIRALKAGKHVLIEKPMARSLAEIDEIGSLAKDGDLVAMVGHTFIYNSAVRYVKKLIDSGELGEIRYISSQRLNLGRIRSDVDALWNFAPHDISIIQYWLGDPEPVSVVRSGLDVIQSGIDDVVFLNITYPNKIMANIHVSWLDPVRVRKLTVVGSKKMIVYDDIAEDKITVYDKGIDRRAVLGEAMDYDSPRYTVFDYRSGDIILPHIHFKEPIKVELEHWFKCIKDNEPCLTGVDHARRVIGILAYGE